MLKVRIIPCLDVKAGRVVKGVQFEDLRDAGDPVASAQAYDQAGADELCFLDIAASHEDRSIMLEVVKETAEQCFMPLTVGGGIKSVEDIRTLLLAGADKVSINTAAVQNPTLVKEAAYKFGAQCIVVALDVKRISQKGEPNRFEIFTHGGRRATGKDALSYAQEVVSLGAGELLVTSMDRDGTQSGFDLELISAISTHVSVPIIASGGGGTPEHFVEAYTKGHATGLLAASLFHSGTLSIPALKTYLKSRGVPVRPTFASEHNV